MKIIRLAENSGSHLVAFVREGNGGYSISTIDLDSENPALIRKIENHPIPQLARNDLAAANDEDLAHKIQTHIANFPSSNAFSGAIVVAHENHLVLEHAWGMAIPAKHIRNTMDTQFCLASIGKVFTAVAVLQLIQQRKLALDEPIGRYWPDYPNADVAQHVTVRQLLDHTGGTGDAFTPEYFAHRRETRDAADYVRLFGRRSLRFEPGARFEYSNYGFILLGRLIEIVSGETYDNYLQAHIFVPANMSDTDSLHEAARGQARAIGFMHSDHGLVPDTQILPWKGTPAGGIYSTAHDLLQFTRAIRSGKLVSRSLMREATTVQTHGVGYGLGLMLFGEGSFGHTGGTHGFNGAILVMPRSGYSLIVLANRDPKMAENMVEFIRQSLPQPGS